MRRFVKPLILFVIGGLLYVLIELLWRGYSHPAMFLVGGICFLAVGGVNEVFPWEMSILLQCLIGGALITVVEFLSGCILNLWLGLGIWDYSDMPHNLLGQICPNFFLAWVGLSLVAIVLDDYLRYWLFGEEKPRYRIW